MLPVKNILVFSKNVDQTVFEIVVNHIFCNNHTGSIAETTEVNGKDVWCKHKPKS